jgi:hypothetical protein
MEHGFPPGDQFPIMTGSVPPVRMTLKIFFEYQEIILEYKQGMNFIKMPREYLL